jgi:hypothetical protein
MIINFSTYNGLAGDLQELLITETHCGIKESILFDRTSFLSFSFNFFAPKKLMRKIKNTKL